MAFALAACGSGASEQAVADPGEPPLAGAAIGGPFTLTSETGDTVRWSDYDGRYRIVYFGYTFCPDICPFDVQRMMAGYEAFKAEHPDRAGQIVPLFVTIDPERDTPEKVAEFTDAFSPDLIGLTGTEEQIAAAAKAFVVYRQRGETTPGGGYLMDHSNQGYLFGPAGEPLALLPVDQSAEGVTAELDKWVR